MQQKKDWDFEVIKEGEENILYIYCEGVSISPLVEDSSIVMIRTIDILSQVSGISKIIFNQKRDYEYDFKQTQILAEIAELYKKLIKSYYLPMKSNNPIDNIFHDDNICSSVMLNLFFDYI